MNSLLLKHQSSAPLDITAYRADSFSSQFRKGDICMRAEQFTSIEGQFSPLQEERRAWRPQLAECLTRASDLVVDDTVNPTVNDAETLAELFPKTWGAKFVKLVPSDNFLAWRGHPPVRIGVVLSGGQAPGGHNVIAGIYDHVKAINPQSQLVGFLNGPHGIFTHNYKEITDELMEHYRNMGGFDMICSGRHKIETPEQKAQSAAICKELDLHGLVVIGGDDSNTNAAILAESFLQAGCTTKVIGCPKTIDGDLRNEYVEASFGFDTACKIYSELIGNLCTDAATSQDRWHFVRLMGRSASNIALECALQTRPNLTFIGEEVLASKRSLESLVNEVVDLIMKRQEAKKNYGIILLPEGLIEFIEEIGILIREINDIVAHGDFDRKELTPNSLKVFESLPDSIRDELLLERDPHGNVQVAKIATEQLLILMTAKELEKRGCTQRFIHTAHYFGYEGRCAMPSNFDANYCYALGHTAAALVDSGMTGYMAVVRNLAKHPQEWSPAGCPITIMMNIEKRKGKPVPVIKKYLVDLASPDYLLFKEVREIWKMTDLYKAPGPIQFEGPAADITNYTLCPPTKDELLPPIPHTKCFFPKSVEMMSLVQADRLRYRVEINPMLKKVKARAVVGKRYPGVDQQNSQFVQRAFPLQHAASLQKAYNVEVDNDAPSKALKIAIVLCGQSVPGANNVVQGLFERCQLTGSQVIGLKGIAGLLSGDHVLVGREELSLYVNQGGFEMLGRTPEAKFKLRTDEGIDAVARTARNLQLDGLVMIGGQTTLTDAAVITEHFLANNIPTRVIAVPGNQENNLRHPLIEAAIGFDSTSKCYSHLIGNLLTDAASATKYWYFVRLMGMVPSHIVQEAALQTHPNFVVISERYASWNMGLDDVVKEIADVVCARAAAGKNFGAVLIPEGLVFQLPQIKALISEVDTILAKTPTCDHPKVRAEFLETGNTNTTYQSMLTPWSLALLKTLPEFFRGQLAKPTPTGRIELSEIGAEQLLAVLVQHELQQRKKNGKYTGSFSAICHYFGFQGRSTIPSNFDCALGTSHGYLASILVESGLTGFATSVRGLCSKPIDWKLTAVPISALMRVMPEVETDKFGRKCPMVPCGEVDLSGDAYRALQSGMESWELEDRFCNPGPIQYYGATADFYNRTLFEEQFKYMSMIQELDALSQYVQNSCSFGVDVDVLKTAVISLRGLASIIAGKKQ